VLKRTQTSRDLSLGILLNFTQSNYKKKGLVYARTQNEMNILLVGALLGS